MHLTYADSFSDFCLRQFIEEPHCDDRPLAFGETQEQIIDDKAMLSKVKVWVIERKGLLHAACLALVRTSRVE